MSAWGDGFAESVKTYLALSQMVTGQTGEGKSMAKLSVDKMGAFGSVPVVPMMPVEAQLAKAYHGTLHLRFAAGDKTYVSGRVPAIPPSRVLALKKALDACETEPTWSGSGTTYWKLDVKPEPEKGRASLYAGSELVGFVLVDPSAEIVSTDESLQSQIESGDGDDDGDDDGNGD